MMGWHKFTVPAICKVVQNFLGISLRICWVVLTKVKPTDYGHPERAFFQKFEIFGLGQTNWAENLWGIWAISGQTISTILALWVPYPWESVAGPLSYKKLWFLGLKHITPKYSQNKIWAVKNSGNSVHTSVFGGPNNSNDTPSSSNYGLFWPKFK